MNLTKELLLSKIPQFEIDPEGTFKYILINVKYNDQSWYLVRGDKHLEFHADNFQKLYSQVKKCGIKWNTISFNESNKFIFQYGEDQVIFECPGGGRKFSVYGYSQSYGQADHNITLQIVKENTNYPEQNYSISFQGY